MRAAGASLKGRKGTRYLSDTVIYCGLRSIKQTQETRSIKGEENISIGISFFIRIIPNFLLINEKVFSKSYFIPFVLRSRRGILRKKRDSFLRYRLAIKKNHFFSTTVMSSIFFLKLREKNVFFSFICSFVFLSNFYSHPS